MTAAKQLAALEARIARGLASFSDAGAALRDVREKRLYTISYGSFDAYCKGKWGLTRRRADQLIEAAAVVDVLAGQGVEVRNALLTSRSAGELAPLVEDPEQLAAAWREAEAAARAAKKPAPTAEHVQKAVQKRKPPPALVKAEEWAQAHPKASPAQIARACRVAKPIAEEARRRHPSDKDETPKATVTDLAEHRKKSDREASAIAAARHLVAVTHRDELIAWAATVPVERADEVAAVFAEVRDLAQLAVELLQTRQASAPPS